MIASAALFLVALFFIKNQSTFQNIGNPASGGGGLSYDNEPIASLVARDIDGDGVLDWEEGLWGTDPTKKDTNEDGVSDDMEVEKLKKQSGVGNLIDEEGGSLALSDEDLTETDKFSREFFSTVATLNQTGEMDPETVEALGTSLADHIRSSSQKKVFTASDLKIINDESIQAVKNYDAAMNTIQDKYPAKGNVMEILGRLLIDEENVDLTVLAEFDPIIEQINKIIDEILKVNVPQILASEHLLFLNNLQALLENTMDMKLYEDDVIVALGAVSKYEENVTTLEETLNNLNNLISGKLNN